MDIKQSQASFRTIRRFGGLLVLCVGLSCFGAAQAQDAATLKARHAELTDRLAKNAFGRPLALESADQFRGHVLRVGCAAAVAEDNQFSAFANRARDRGRRIDQRLRVGTLDPLVQRDGRVDGRREPVTFAQGDPSRRWPGTPRP